MERITIVGLGPVGTSMGQALRRTKLPDTEIVGTSASRDAMSTASRLGAVDKTEATLRRAVAGTSLLVLDVPVDEAMEIIEAVGPLLASGCVVTDTAGPKAPVIDRAKRCLPDDVAYVGGHPLIPAGRTRAEEADPALLSGADYCVLTPEHTNPHAVSAVVQLVETVGAKPLFLEVAEYDSYLAATEYLPLLLSAAYVNCTIGSQGWREMRRLASSAFEGMSSLASRDPKSTLTGSTATPDLLAGWLDALISELQAFRGHIGEGRNDALLENLIGAWEGRAQWYAGASDDDGRPKLPSAGRYIATALLGDRLAGRVARLGGDHQKKAPWKYDRDR